MPTRRGTNYHLKYPRMTNQLEGASFPRTSDPAFQSLCDRQDRLFDAINGNYVNFQ